MTVATELSSERGHWTTGIHYGEKKVSGKAPVKAGKE
jgi:hypothetical protein